MKKEVKTKKVAWTIDARKLIQRADALFMKECRCCGESLLCAGCEAIGVRCDLVPDIALGLGGGVGLQGETCGAVTGAALAVSVAWAKKTPLYDDRKMATFESAGRICDALKAKWGSVTCRKLCGLNLARPGGLEKLMAGVKAEKCTGFVKDAARELAKELKKIMN